MYIHDDHMHYGSAIIQVAEDRHCTAIKALHYCGRLSRCAFRVEFRKKRIGLYVKYRSEPDVRKPPLYNFPVDKYNLGELESMRKKRRLRVFLALVCVKASQICCLPYKDFRRMIEKRREEIGKREPQYVIKVSLPRGCYFRVGVSTPGKKGGMETLLEKMQIPQSNFPKGLFVKG
jgi:hypothetical protein